MVHAAADSWLYSPLRSFRRCTGRRGLVHARRDISICWRQSLRIGNSSTFSRKALSSPDRIATGLGPAAVYARARPAKPVPLPGVRCARQGGDFDQVGDGIAIGRCNFWANRTSPNSRLRQVVAPDTVGYLQEARALPEKTAGLQFITVCYRILNTRWPCEIVRAMTFKDLTPSAY